MLPKPAKEVEHVPTARIVEVALTEEPVFTPAEATHVIDCSRCLALFTKLFNQTDHNDEVEP